MMQRMQCMPDLGNVRECSQEFISHRVLDQHIEFLAEASDFGACRLYDLSGGGLDFIRNDLKLGSLAATVRTDQSQPLTSFNLPSYILEGFSQRIDFAHTIES